jgi:DNA-binding XRE family transcriptional regulator
MYTKDMPNIKELREKVFLSVPELAKLSGISRKVIYDIEAGKHRPIKRTIRALAEALKVKPEEISF